MTDNPNSEQAEFWSDGGGLDWVTFDTQLDELFAGVNAALLRIAKPKPTDTVLDIGCGTGATTRDFAAQTAQADGIDISTTMLAHAQKTAPTNTTFTRADAQTELLPADHYDHLVSRFGVMFFDNPIAAFANVRRALKPTGQLTMACWAPFKQNPWFTIPRFIATDLLGSPPPFDPRAPGPFAFADTDYALGILGDAGFINAAVQTHDIPLSLSGNAAHAAKLSSYIGPADSVIRAMNGTAADKAKIIAKTQEKLRDYEQNGTVTVPAKIHLYTAKNH
ncbi:class I SAM-dependent methyltransferase [Amylibacter sp. IMCC11727]|uniref:class I SAM-dependent methyltransferase n=1 Tax=Amylibacter sp. IMCC11727 TaxID=3039851 RepID=UPI00244DD621|nr:class I SAM-dependent methyltransferase [Amylibacter sp. IMCC11727]WGI22512.1 class I SAM-dependent methyltransferase [Amylibacter sp. IMCC11727]